MRSLPFFFFFCFLTFLSAACTKDECPGGARPYTLEWFECDEVARTCQPHKQTECPCPAGAYCPTVSSAPYECRGGISGVAEWVAQAPTVNAHVVDGAFTGEEWTGATRLEGMFTDVYMDYRDGRLYFLNDWRSNEEGITPNCFNYFQIRVGTGYLDLRVFGDGHVEVTRDYVRVDVDAEGAYGLGPSPKWATPHTIYEFSIPLVATQIDVCCYDPITSTSCDRLTHEPTILSLRPTTAGVEVSRQLPPGVPRLELGATCGTGEGVCVDGARCEKSGAIAICVSIPDAGPPADAGPPDAGAPPDDFGPPV